MFLSLFLKSKQNFVLFDLLPEIISIVAAHVCCPGCWTEKSDLTSVTAVPQILSTYSHRGRHGGLPRPGLDGSVRAMWP